MTGASDGRWNDLITDLEAQAAAADIALRAAEVSDRTRHAVGEISWMDRVRASVDSPLVVRVSGASFVRGVVSRVGPDWFLLTDPAGRESMVSAAAVEGVRGLNRYVATEHSIVRARLGLVHLLRGLARDRSTLGIHLTDGSTIDATIDRVGADFVEVTTRVAGEQRRLDTARICEMVPIRAIAVISARS